MPRSLMSPFVLVKLEVRLLVPAPYKTIRYGLLAGPFSFGVATGVAFGAKSAVICL